MRVGVSMPLSASRAGSPRVDAGAQPHQPLPGFSKLDDASWRPDLTEQQLALELELLLNEQHYLQPAKSSGAVAPKALLDRGLEDADFEAGDGGWEWQQHGKPVEQSGTAEEASLKWLARARTDRRRRSMRTAFGWVVTIAIVGSIIAAAANVLTGWTPDLQGMAQMGNQIFR